MSVKVYRYGLLPPTEGSERVSDQMRLAHKYANRLTEIERGRRDGVAAIMGAVPVVSAAETAVVERTEALKGSSEEDAPAAKKALKAAYAELKAARKIAREDQAVAASISAQNEASHALLIAARAECGVYWGTYLQVEQAADAARKGTDQPRFHRWSGEGAVAVQLQHGLGVGDLLAGEDRRAQVSLVPLPVPGRGGKPLPRMRLRVGSEGLDPIWAEWPLIYHRELPEGAMIKWAKVTRRLVAGREQWSAHLTLEGVPELPAARSGGVVAVDLGWRREAGTLRVAGVATADGDEDVLLDSGVLRMLERAESLRSIRDRNLNELRALLQAWREAAGDLPEEHRERLAFLPQWKSPSRFAGLIHWWRSNRTSLDADIYATAEAWRKQDKHLWSWEANSRRKALARRKDQYRCLAKRLAEQYSTLVLERLDLRRLAVIPEPDEERESNPRARAQRVAAAPSDLRLALEQAFRARGATIVTVPPAGPASALLAAYSKQAGVEQKPVVARASRFSKMHKKMSPSARGA